MRERKQATALTYGGSGAPKVVATGRERIAQKIIEVAQEAGIPVREDPALAQALAQLEVGHEIPPALYQAVAEALVWALSLERALARSSTLANGRGDDGGMKTDTPVTVLIVEDDDLVLRLLSNVLRRAGHKVVTAMDGATALTIARREVPQVVIVDILLPAGNGLQFVERMRCISALAATSAIVMTGGDVDTYGRQAEALGASFLPKPLSPAELLTAVEEVLSSATPMSALLGMAAV